MRLCGQWRWKTRKGRGRVRRRLRPSSRRRREEGNQGEADDVGEVEVEEVQFMQVRWCCADAAV